MASTRATASIIIGSVLDAGTVLDGRYEIVGPIAEGGMGAVFRARRRLLGDDVALKIVRSEFARDQEARERFLRESRACAQLRHPNIVSILDYNLDADGRPFLVMELLNGRSLRQELAARGALGVDEVQTILLPLCNALQLAHDHGILHRDLKPANIVAHDFGSGMRAYKIVDFGLVRDLRSESTRLTGVNMFVGTFTYAAPEQVLGGELDARSDQYSLAVVAYELLTGQPPFDESDPGQLIASVLTRPMPLPTSVRADLPKWIDVVLGRALAKSPGDRYPSIAAFGEALQSDAGAARTVIIGAPAHPTPVSGALLATYELGERLGPGRLGSDVFSGTHRALGHPVAIRMLRRSRDRNWDGVRARFLREAKTLQISHESIMQVRDYGEEGDLVYLVTDFIHGPSLREVLRNEGRLAWPRLEPLLGQLTDAARALHRKGGLLCGLSPDIIRVTIDDDGDVSQRSIEGAKAERLLISSAGIWEAQDLLATLGDATLRGTALADFELHYVAPELLTGQHADVRSDVFSIGVLAYEMGTGALPYDGPSMPALLGAMLHGRPADPRSAQPTLPEPAAAAIIKALDPVPAHRFETVKDFAAALFS
ncbi:MAG TPA: serine/threonine-protein kinase [Vicinamibacterales bacterium]|nr:serine/threonine-protein kinase [Vicinamibacterales bacterium]